MSDCGVCIGGGDGEYPEFQSIRIVKCRKPFNCCECSREVGAGEVYSYYVGKIDGDMFYEKTCRQCAEIRESFSCESWPMFGDLWSEMEEVFPHLNTSCFDKLATPEAKAFLRGKWMAWKGLAA